MRIELPTENLPGQTREVEVIEDTSFNNRQHMEVAAISSGNNNHIGSLCRSSLTTRLDPSTMTYRISIQHLAAYSRMKNPIPNTNEIECSMLTVIFVNASLQVLVGWHRPFTNGMARPKLIRTV